MCRKKVYYNTYADGVQDVTEKTYPCRESGGRLCAHPETRAYDRKLPYGKLQVYGPNQAATTTTTFFPGDLPTPRPSKSPSPAGMPELSRTSSKHHRHSSSRRLEAELDLATPPRLKRTSTMPGGGHVVVVDQAGASASVPTPRHSSQSIPLGPVSVADELGHRRRSSRDFSTSTHHSHHSRDRDPRDPPRASTTYLSRHNSISGGTSGAQAYIVVDDERERRRSERRQRRMSVSGIPEAPSAPQPPHIYSSSTPTSSSKVVVPEPSRRSSTLLTVPRVFTGGAGSSHSNGTTSSGASSSSAKQPLPKRARWDSGVSDADAIRRQREQQNIEIANRRPVPEVHQQTPAPATAGAGAVPLKGILKNTTNPVANQERERERERERQREREKDKDKTRELRRAIERERKELERERKGLVASASASAVPRTGTAAVVADPLDMDLDLYDRDRLRARFGAAADDDAAAERERRRRRSKVWVAGDRYQYF